MGVVKSFGGCLSIISGTGSLDVAYGAEMTKNNLDESDRLFGTVAVASISVPV